MLLEPSDSLKDQIIGIVKSVADGFGKKLIGAVELIEIDEENLHQRSLRPADYYMPGFIAAFIMTNGVIGVSTVVSEYRRQGVLKRLIASPLSRATWVTCERDKPIIIGVDGGSCLRLTRGEGNT